MAKVECELITQDAIDVEIGGSVGVLLQAKRVEITENGTAVVAPDEGFDGMQRVEINTNAPENITGVIGVPDGMSIAQLLCSSSAASSVTEIVDTNVGWTMSKEFNNGVFPSCNEITINANRIVLGKQGDPSILLSNVSSIKKVNLNATYAHCSFNIPADGELNAPNLVEFYVNNGGYGQTGQPCREGVYEN